MIFEIYIWVLSFVGVFAAVLWIMVNHASKYEKKRTKKLKEYPFVSIAVPVFNEADTIMPTLKSILSLDYPKDKIEIIIVDDKSKDNTVKVAEGFISGVKNIKIIKHKKNLGKAGALNSALKTAKGDFFWVFDADSFASRDLLKKLLLRFQESEDDVAAVVSITLIHNQGKWIEKMQRLEYIMAAFTRKLMGSVDTLHITNALSLFRTKVLREIGGFDVGNLTEDFEIAMRLRSNKYRIVMCENSNFHTHVPNTIKSMWMQRVRWFRGFIYNNLKYKNMVLNKKYGLLGMYQIPLEVFFFLVVFISVAIFGYHIIKQIIDLVFQIFIMRFEIFDFTFPTFKKLILNLNWRLTFPSLAVLFLGLYIYLSAHKYAGEKWKFYLPSILYIFVYPLFRSMQWIHAFILEFGRAERKW